MPIVRRNYGRGHGYIDTDTGEKWPGVTTVGRDGIPKPALEKWKVGTTIDYAIDHWDRLGELPISERRKELFKAQYKSRDEGAVRGTKVHDLAARLVAGESVKIPEGYEGYVDSYKAFLDEFDVAPLLVETTIVSRTHRYCGTLDLLADLIDPQDPEPDFDKARRERWLIDLATNASGVYGDRAVQLAGYRYADSWGDDDGVELPIPEVTRTGVVWITPTKYELVPVEAGPDQFKTFLYAQHIGRFVDDSYMLVGDPIIPPHTSTWKLVKDE
jgi:hypothetical protein